MPNRIVREGINDSRAVNSLSDSGELFYRRLISVVDDFGRFEADPELLRGELFKRQLDRWPLSRVSEALTEVSTVLTDDGHPLVIVYFSPCSSKKYLEIHKFNQRMRAAKSKYPEPSRSSDGHLTVIGQTDDGHPHASRARTPPHTTPTPTPTPSAIVKIPSTRFPEFWDKYPVKDGVQVAMQVWLSLVSAENEEAVFACFARYLVSDRCARSPKNAANWLHDAAKDGWNSNWPRAPESPSAKKGFVASVTRVMGERVARGEDPLS